LRWFIAATLLLSGVGIAISYAAPWSPATAAKLLKFYWFRLADVMIPAGVALEFARGAVLPGASGYGRRTAWAMSAVIAAWGIIEIAPLRFRPAPPRGELLDADTYENWKLACRWIDENLPEDSLVVAPRSFASFRWYAHRAEFANWKDVPQDADSLLHWKSRLDELYGSANESGGWVNFVPSDRLLAVCRKYEITHIVTFRLPKLELPLLYSNNSFAVYRVGDPNRGALPNLP
jgi:hypothetical protein